VIEIMSDSKEECKKTASISCLTPGFHDA